MHDDEQSNITMHLEGPSIVANFYNAILCFVANVNKTECLLYKTVAIISRRMITDVPTSQSLKYKGNRLPLILSVLINSDAIIF